MNRIQVTHSAGSYDIVVQDKASEALASIVAEAAPGCRVILLIDPNVNSNHPFICPGVERIILADGERHKSRKQWSELTNQLLESGHDRNSVIVAVGGGVTTDLSGFVAATFMRGIPWIAVPTTTLAMCDAAVGGKTGVDTVHGKNLVGAFHQPNVVVADPGLLSSLPEELFLDGLAEAIKHAAIVDEGHFQWLASNAKAIIDRDDKALEELITTSCRIKAAVVASDERESGMRAILNAGHTVGHALEHASNYQLSHGKAVAIGLVEEAMIGEKMGVTKAGTAEVIANLLEKFHLPQVRPDSISEREIEEALEFDKKNREGEIHMVLLSQIGAVARPKGGGWTWAIS